MFEIVCFLSFWFQTLLAQNEQQWRFKKFFQLQKMRVCCPHFCKNAFFFFVLPGKRQKEWTKKTEGPVQLLFLLGFCFLLPDLNGLFPPKKTVCLLGDLFSGQWKKQRKKKLSCLCTNQLLVACSKKKRTVFWQKGDYHGRGRERGRFFCSLFFFFFFFQFLHFFLHSKKWLNHIPGERY